MRISDWSSDVCSSDLKSGYQLCPPVSSGSSKLREIRDVASSKTRFTALSAPISNDPPTRYFRNGARYIGNRITVQWEHRTGYFRNGQPVLREIGRASWRERGVPYV